MQTQFNFRHMESSDALRHYTEERLEKIKRYFSDPLKVNCTFEVAKIQHLAQFEVTLRNGLQLHASESTENMYSSIDMALAKMERQVRRYKDRITSHKPGKGRSTQIRQAVIAEQESAAELGLGPISASMERGAEPPRSVNHQERGPKVIRSKEFVAKSMDVTEAIMQMNLMHKSFYVFAHANTGDINIVYRLEDGNIGLIETHGHVEETN